MLIDNDENKKDIWFHGFVYGTIIGIFAGIAIAKIFFM